jgi:hypothetical protein
MQPEQDYNDYCQNHEHGAYNLFKRLIRTDANDFNMQVRLRYRDLRDNKLATDSILKRFSTYLDRFKLCGAAQREYDKWNGDTDIAGHYLDFDNEMDYLTDWFTRRMKYLDTQRFDIASLPSEYVLGDVNGDGTVDVSDYIGVANYILGISQQGFNEKAGDVNKDGVIDVSDYLGIGNIIHTGSVYGNGN